ncbi:flippase-like domain-containing protein [bacterium]|nr:flippase-like domain-containing protein [bacterium]
MDWPFTNKKKWIGWSKILVALCVLGLLIHRISWIDLRNAVVNAQHGWITAALILLAPNLYCQFKRWQLIVRQFEAAISAKEVVRSLFAGITLGLITPGRIGDLGRTVFIPGADWLGLMGLMLIEKWYALLVVYFAGLWGLLPFLRATLRPELWVPVETTGLALVLAGIALALHPAFLNYVLKRFNSSGKHKRLHQVLNGVTKLTPRVSRSLLFYTVAQVTVYLMQFYLLIRAFTPLPLWSGLSAVAAVMWSKTLLPISLGDLGIRESASIYFLGKLQVSEAAAFDSALLLFAINVLLPAVAGFAVLMKSRVLQSPKDSMQELM